MTKQTKSRSAFIVRIPLWKITKYDEKGWEDYNGIGNMGMFDSIIYAIVIFPPFFMIF